MPSAGCESSLLRIDAIFFTERKNRNGQEVHIQECQWGKQNFCKSMSKNCLFSLSCYISSTSISLKILYNAHIIPHINYASVVWDGCSEVHFKKIIKKSLHRRAGKLILPDPSLSTEQKVSALGILSLPQQLTMRKYLCINVLLNVTYISQRTMAHTTENNNNNNKNELVVHISENKAEGIHTKHVNNPLGAGTAP